MDHSLFGCLRSPHAPTQGLHPAISQSRLALHHRGSHMFPDLPASSPRLDEGAAEDCGAFGGSEQRKQPVLPQQDSASWPGPLHRLCVPPPQSAEPRSSSPDQRGPSLQSRDQTGTSCSCEEAEGKSEPSGRPFTSVSTPVLQSASLPGLRSQDLITPDHS